MSPMYPADFALSRPASPVRRAQRRLGALAALLAGALAFAPGSVHAETGGALPQGYTSDISAAAPAPVSAPSLPVQQVDDSDEEEVEEAEVEESDYTDTDPSALSDFQEPLAPYGTWTEDATYGTVWVPNANVVGADFAPYQTAGHWALTDEGDWLWVSDYDWGYIPFHYGRWTWINARGWAWIPGRVYAPAWVSWRVGDAGYLGWAPMPPTWYWSGGVATNLWVTPYAAYCFVPSTYVFHDHVHRYVVRDAGAVRSIAAGTRSYTPARPTITGGARARGGAHFRVAAPSLSEAGVPSSAAPKARVSADPRARAYATRASTASVRRGFPVGRVNPHAAAGARLGDVAARPNVRDVRPSAPTVRGPSHGTPVFDGTPRGHSRPTLSAPSSRPTFTAPPASRPTLSAPSSRPTFIAPPASRPTLSAPSSRPTFIAPPASRPTLSAPAAPRPTFSSPSFSRPTLSAPPASRPSFSAPHFSAPAAPRSFTPSAPSGGAHFSGGRHR